MKNKFTPILLIIFGCALGIFGSYLFCEEPQAVATPVKKNVRKQLIASDTNEVARLHNRIRQLEAQLAKMRSEAEAAKEVRAAEVKPEPPAEVRRPGPPNFRETMANLKKNDPKRYEEMRKRFEQHRQRRAQRSQNRLDYLSSIDTSGMSAQEKSNHERLQQLLSQRGNLTEIDPAEATDEEMRAAMEERRRLDREIRAANRTERDTLLRETASALGLQDEDAQMLTDTIREVLEATAEDHSRHPPAGAPPPPGS